MGAETEAGGGADGADFVKAFLFGDAVPAAAEGGLDCSLVLDARCEGWRGIPHGGIGMGAVLALAGMCPGWPRTAEALYPLAAAYRLGGASLRSGQRVTLQLRPAGDGVTAAIITDGDLPPYLTATLAPGRGETQRREAFTAWMPRDVDCLEARERIPLPCYRHCFVCGCERDHPGLERRFWLLAGPERIVLSPAGFEGGAAEPFFRFREGEAVHPLALIALLDETLGWAGFMATGSGAVTVRIGYTFYRPVHPGERMLSFGRNERVRGGAGGRLFYWASGGAAVAGPDGRLEIVAASEGQYLCVPELTEQMRQSLIPAAWTARAFALAGAAP